MDTISRLLGKRREETLLSIPWRPLWDLVVATQLSYVSLRTRAGPSTSASYRYSLLSLTVHSRPNFPPATLAEVVAAPTPPQGPPPPPPAHPPHPPPPPLPPFTYSCSLILRPTHPH